MSRGSANNLASCQIGGLLLLVIIISSCQPIYLSREVRHTDQVSSINTKNKYIKAHMKDGQLYILYNWYYDSAKNALAGWGNYLDVNRKLVDSRGNLVDASKTEGIDPFIIAIDNVALLETNDPGPSLATRLIIPTVVTAGFGVYCLTNPKACFGSCPTYYASNGDSMVLQAEGFSESIAPSLEKNDIDMLYWAKPSKDFELKVTNEALETHAIRYMQLLAFDKNQGERVFAGSDGKFYRCSNLQPAQSTKGDKVLDQKLNSVDGKEYYSAADENNLNSFEELSFKFEASAGKDLGLVIAKRQTLLTTFLMYQGLAYMGATAGHWLAKMETGNFSKGNHLFDLLGSIEVYVKDEKGTWIKQGSIHETGPIATDINIIPLTPMPNRNMEVKIRMNKGLWRIDWLCLATITGMAEPERLMPYAAERIEGSEPAPLNKLLDPNDYLVTLPGHEYRVRFMLPSEKVELFLDSKGYYLEWMRDEWMKEQSMAKLNTYINKPALYLKKAARDYKKVEASMDKIFWESRYEKK